MSPDDSGAFVGGLLCGSLVTVVVMVTVMVALHKAHSETWQKDCIQHNAAHYDPLTAEFKWNAPPAEAK